MAKAKLTSITSQFSEVEYKLLILYLVNQMEIPMPSNKIEQFILESNYMDIYTLRNCLSDLLDINFLEKEKTTDSNISRYTTSLEGSENLEMLQTRLPAVVRNKIKKYIDENRQEVKRELDVSANILGFPGDYIVKCSAYDDTQMLIELNLSVVTYEEAYNIKKNWADKVASIYSTVINEMTQDK